MKKHLIFLLSLIILPAAPMMAGNGLGLIDFGVKAGLTTSKVKYVHANKGMYDLETSGRAGFHLGVMSRINLPMLHIQPEILFSSASYKLNVYDDGNRLSASNVKINTVEVPVLAGLKLLWFRFQAGPMFTVMTESKLKNKGAVDDIKLDKPAVSYLLGIGFDAGSLNFDVRYNGRFARGDQSLHFNGGGVSTDYKNKYKSWMFSVAYVF